MASLTDILSGNAEDAAKAQIEGIVLGTKAAASASARRPEELREVRQSGARRVRRLHAAEPRLLVDLRQRAGAEWPGRQLAAAVSAYQSSPGYQFQLDQGLQALRRSASSRGMLGSGSTSADILGYSQGLADQDYSSWLDRLQGLGSQGIGMAGARAGIQTGIGGKAYETGESLADLGWKAATGAGNALAQKESAEGQGLLGGISLGTKLLGSALGGGSFGGFGA